MKKLMPKPEETATAVEFLSHLRRVATVMNVSLDAAAEIIDTMIREARAREGDDFDTKTTVPFPKRIQ